MMLRKFIGWSILLGAFMLGYAGFPVKAETAGDRIALKQSSVAPAQLRFSGWPPAGWMVQQFDGLVEIKFPEMAREVELPQGLIGRLGHRVASLESELRGRDLYLRLTLDCACSVAVTSDGAEAVLIDVINPNGADRAETATAPKTAPLPTVKPGADHAGGPTADVTLNGRLNIAEAQQHLMEQLLRAADAGMVDLRPDPSESPAESGESGQPIADASGTTAKPPAPQTSPEGTADSANSSEAQADPVAGKAQAENHAAYEDVIAPRPTPTCFPDEALAFQDPELGDPFARQASELNAKLVGEFDTVDEDAAIKLVQLYLSAGIAAEAVAVVNEFIPDHPWAELYREVASIVMDELPALDASLRKEDCGGAQQLWRLAAEALTDGSADIAENAKKSMVPLEAQPRLIREFMASRIGMAASESGEWEVARRMEAMANRSVSPFYGPSGPALLLSARLDAWHDRPEEALLKLKKAREFPGSTAEDALLQLAKAALTNSDLAATETSYLQADLAMLAKDDRGGKRGLEAFELWVKLHHHDLGRDSALTVLNQGVEDGLLPADRRTDLLTEIAQGNDFSESSRPLALVYLDNPIRFEGAMQKPGFRRAIVESMIALGVPSLATDVMTPEDRTDLALGLDLARAHLKSSDPKQAIAGLQLLPESFDRNQLMARALLADGQISEAESYIADASTTDREVTDQVSLMDAQIEAAIQSGDADSALDLGVQRLSLAQDGNLAERIALVALDAGHSEVPPSLEAALSKDQLEALQMLFRQGPPPEDITDIAEMDGFIDQLTSEISTIEDLLTDG